MPFFARDQWSNIDSIVRFVVPVLVNFTAMKYQGTPDSPFEARPITMFLSIFTLLLYCCLSLPLVVRLPAFGTACGARTFLFLRILSLSLPVALLASLLFRGLSFFLLCLPMLILLLPAHLWSLMQNLKQRILVVAFVRLFRRRGIALLPRTVANTHFM
ncbi:uncharacterized protein J3R85_018016 [Psidium guajava]|nr:uncharacterized protein J3R85_018016 [Psidium guajava]